jgi:hypothetical protein
VKVQIYLCSLKADLVDVHLEPPEEGSVISTKLVPGPSRQTRRSFMENPGELWESKDRKHHKECQVREKPILTKTIACKINSCQENNSKCEKKCSLEVGNCEDLCAAIRQKLPISHSVINCRVKLRATRQGNTRKVQSHNTRFRQRLKEPIYAIRKKHSKPVSSRIAIEEEKTDQ